MKAKIMLRVALVIGFMVLSVTAAHAGGASGTPPSIQAFFECQSVGGAANSGRVVSINDTSTEEVIHPRVMVGSGVLACRQVDVRDLSFTPSQKLIPDSSDRLRCYNIAVQGEKGDPQFLNFADALATETNLRVFGSKYLCVTSVVTE
jgi:hypothetical protein